MQLYLISSQVYLQSFSLPAIAEKYCVFTPIKGTEGLGGNRVRNITQLPDGRMMIITEGLLNLYDGTDFNYLHYNQKHFCPLSAYSGFHHEYIDSHGYMWIKNQYQLMVVDIKHECLVEQPDSLLATWGISSPIKDFFMDKTKNIWIINDKDELILVDKDNMTGESELYSLADFSVRLEENIAKAYLLGKYGAVPYIDEE